MILFKLLFRNFLTSAALCFILSSIALYSQNNTKSTKDNDVEIHYLSPDGQRTNSPIINKFSQEKQTLLNRLMEARSNGNSNVARSLQKKLDELSGSTDMTLSNDPSITGVIDSTGGQQNVSSHFDGTGFNSSIITTGNILSIATQTSSRSTAIFAAVTEDVFASGDICRVYVSYDGGVSWVLKYTFNGFASTVSIRSNELDIEPIISGADTILYVGFGYNMNNRSQAYFMRVNIKNGTSMNGAWNFWGSQHPCECVNIYNPKITSDNSRYTTDTYVYFTVSRDSAYVIGRMNTQQMAVNTSPFTGNILTNRYRYNCGGFVCAVSTFPDYAWQDICYYNNGIADRLYTIFNLGTGQIFLYWSDDYGVSPTSGLAIYESSYNLDQIQVQSCGGISNQQIAIAYRREYTLNGNDWDFRCLFSINGGTDTGSFLKSYVDFTAAQTKFVSMQSIARSNGRYVFSWADSVNGINGTHKFRQTNNSGVSFTSEPVLSSPVGVGVLLNGGTHAGYRAGGSNDSSFTIWSGSDGGNAFCSNNIFSTIGIQQTGSEIPAHFSLGRNYPNPFNPTTEFKISIPRSAHIKLVVYDILGKEIEILTDRVMNPGSYNVKWDASKFSSGIYFYRMTAESNGIEYSNTMKMVLVK